MVSLNKIGDKEYEVRADAITEALKVNKNFDIITFFKVVHPDGIVKVDELPSVKAGEINIECTRSHKDADTLTIEFKNLEQFNVIKMLHKQWIDVIAVLRLPNPYTGEPSTCGTFYLVKTNEVYERNAWNVTAEFSDWKHFEDYRLIVQNTGGVSSDADNFAKLQYTGNGASKNQSINWLLNDIYYRSFAPSNNYPFTGPFGNPAAMTIAKTGNPRVEGFWPERYSGFIKINMDVDNELGFIETFKYLDTPPTVGDMRREIVDFINTFYDGEIKTNKPIVSSRLIDENGTKVEVNYRGQNIINIDNKTNTNVINKVDYTIDRTEQVQLPVAFLSGEWPYNKYAAPHYERAYYMNNKVVIREKRLEDTEYCEDPSWSFDDALGRKLEQEFTKPIETFDMEIELSLIPFLDYDAGDMLAFKNFGNLTGDKKIYFTISEFSFSLDHENGYVQTTLNLEEYNYFKMPDIDWDNPVTNKNNEEVNNNNE